MSNNTAPTKVSFVYDTEPCARCGGSGSYSRCDMHGTDCFKCVVQGNPAGLQATKAATKAKRAMDFARAVLLCVDASTIKVGDVINAGARAYGSSKRRRLTVQKIEITCASMAGEYKGPALPWAGMVAWCEANPGAGCRPVYAYKFTGEKATYQVGLSDCVQTIATPAQVQTLVEFARTLKGVTVVES